MSFTIPNVPVASFLPQATVSSQDFAILADAARGNGVVADAAACLVTQRAAGANLSVDVAAGDIVFEGAVVTVTAGNLAVSAAHATLPRIDVVSVTSTGVKVLTAGTPAASPLPPAIPAAGGINNVCLAFVYVPANDTAITNAQITDKRMGVNTPGGASIPNDSVTFAKMQNISAASRLLGRGSAAGSGDPQELTLGTNLTMSGTVLNATGGTGGGDFSSNTATSVDGEAVLFSGTAGKTGKRATGTGPARLTAGVLGTGSTNLASEVTGDLPLANVTPATAASRLLGRGSAAGAGDFQEVTLGANLTMTGTVLAASGGTGTTPTGTGFRHVVAGTEDAASKLVDTADVNADQITYAKLQNVSAASKLLGRGAAAGAGDPEELTLGTNLSMSGTTLNASAASGAPTTADYLVRTSDAGLSAERVVTDTATVTWDWATPGQAKANATGGGGAADIFAIVAADVVHATNSTTLSDITGLTFNTTASATELWQVEILLLTHCNTSGGTTADYKFGWSVSGAQTLRWGGNPETGVGTTGIVVTGGTQATTLAYGSGSNVDGLVRLIALVKSNGAAGAVQLRFAQNTLMTGGIVTIRADSYMIAKKIRS